MLSRKWANQLKVLLGNGHFWLVLALLALCSIFHYAEQLGILGTTAPSEHFGLTRHAMDRVLFLIPIIYCGFIFGLRAGLITSAVALVVMLPRAISISPVTADALFEIGSVLIVGALACLWLESREREKERHREALEELGEAHQQLQAHIRISRSNEKRLATLNAISAVLTQSLEPEEVLRRAIEMVMEVMEVETVLIFSLDEKAKELKLVAYDGASEEFARDVNRMKVGEGFNGIVAETGEPMMVDDASHDPRLTRSAVKKMKLQAELIVPLKSKGMVVGTLCVAMRRPREFLPEEVELLNAIGNQIGISMENARLYEKERLFAEQLRISERNYRGLFEGANDAIWVHDLEGNIISVNKATEKLTGYTVEELAKMNVASFLDEEGLDVARKVRLSLLHGEPIEQPYEQRLIKRDGTQAIFMVTSSLVTTDGQPTGFQHISRDVTEEKRMQENLRFYVQQITEAQEAERKRIARELHDDTTQSLYAISRQVDNIIRNSARLTDEDIAQLKDLRQQIGEALNEVRRFTQDLRPSILDDFGLLSAVGWLTGELEREHGIKAKLKVIGTERRFSPEVETPLFRIVQEALSNIRRHAQASIAEVAIEFAQTGISLTISDDGKGFELPQRLGDLARSGKLGLAGMQERARLLGGSLTLHSEPGKGTAVVLKAPI